MCGDNAGRTRRMLPSHLPVGAHGRAIGTPAIRSLSLIGGAHGGGRESFEMTGFSPPTYVLGSIKTAPALRPQLRAVSID